MTTHHPTWCLGIEPADREGSHSETLQAAQPDDLTFRLRLTQPADGEFSQSQHLILAGSVGQDTHRAEDVTLADREEISRGLAEGLEQKQIARLIDRNPSVISRDVARHGGRAEYRAVTADESATAGRRRPKPYAVDRSPRLRAVVTELLRTIGRLRRVPARLH